MKPRPLLTFIILATIAAYFYFAVPDCLRNRAVCFGDAALAPFRYRILQPVLEYAAVPDGNQEAVVLFDFALQALLTALLFVGLYSWLRFWLSFERAITACFMLALVMIVSFHFYLRSVSTTFELTCVVWGLWCLSHTRRSSHSPA